MPYHSPLSVNMEGGKALSDKVGAEEVESYEGKNLNIKHHAVAALSPEEVEMEKR